VIDANSGLEWSKQIGKIYDGTNAAGKKLATEAGGVLETLTPAEYDKWVKATESVDKDWVGEATAKGANGAALLEDAKAMIRKYGG
jgi:TRAP-type transport system periplasmic protein